MIYLIILSIVTGILLGGSRSLALWFLSLPLLLVLIIIVPIISLFVKQKFYTIGNIGWTPVGYKDLFHKYTGMIISYGDKSWRILPCGFYFRI